jgi:hypothetical protein
MKIIPKSKQEWLSFVLLPRKAYAVIGPALFFVSRSLPLHRHAAPAEAETFLVLDLLPCAALLLFTELVLSFVGPKYTALPCFCFGLAALVVGFSLLPSLASASER